MFTALMSACLFLVIFASAAGYGRAMDELFGSPAAPRSAPPQPRGSARRLVKSFGRTRRAVSARTPVGAVLAIPGATAAR